MRFRFHLLGTLDANTKVPFFMSNRKEQAKVSPVTLACSQHSVLGVVFIVHIIIVGNFLTALFLLSCLPQGYLLNKFKPSNFFINCSCVSTCSGFTIMHSIGQTETQVWWS
jgi:hypothetical protein